MPQAPSEPQKIELNKQNRQNKPPVVVVHGTIAVDIQGRYPGSFSRFSPGDDMTMQLSELTENFGGCAMNICYGLRMLGLDALPVVRAGRDWRPGYEQHLQEQGIRCDGIVEADVPWSSRALIFTDSTGSQITAFYPGSANAAGPALPDAAALAQRQGAAFVVLAPDVPVNMLEAARSLAAAGVFFMLDTGQGTPDFSPEQARELVQLAPSIICNEIEWSKLAQLAGVAADQLPAHCQWLLVTNGAEGCRLLRHGQPELHVAPVPCASELDHTGCGDAFRAGLVWGLVQQLPLAEAARAGALCAVRNLQTRGTQHWLIDAPGLQAELQALAKAQG